MRIISKRCSKSEKSEGNSSNTPERTEQLLSVYMRNRMVHDLPLEYTVLALGRESAIDDQIGCLEKRRVYRELLNRIPSTHPSECQQGIPMHIYATHLYRKTYAQSQTNTTRRILSTTHFQPRHQYT